MFVPSAFAADQPDPARIHTTGDLRVVEAWGGPDGARFGVPGEPGAAALSADGRFALIEGDGPVLFEVPAGRVVGRWEEPRYVGALALSHDGGLAVAGASGSNSVYVWRQGSLLFHLTVPEREGYADGIGAVGLSPDERWLVAVAETGDAVGWDLVRDRVVWKRRDRSHTRGGVGAAFSPNGTALLLALPRSSTVELLEWPSGRVRWSIQRPWLEGAAFADDGTVWTVGGPIQHHAVEDGRVLSSVGGDAVVFAPLPRGRALVGTDEGRVADEQSRIEVWDLMDERAPRPLLFTAVNAPDELVASADGRWALGLVTVGWLPEPRLWDLTTGRQAFEGQEHAGPIVALVERDGELVSTSTDGTWIAWEGHEPSSWGGSRLEPGAPPGPDDANVAVSLTGRLRLIGTGDTALSEYPPFPKRVGELRLSDGDQTVWTQVTTSVVGLGSDGVHVFSGHLAGELRAWAVAEGTPAWSVTVCTEGRRDGRLDPPWVAVLSVSAAQVVVGCDTTLSVRDPATGAELARAEFAPDAPTAALETAEGLTVGTALGRLYRFR